MTAVDTRTGEIRSTPEMARIRANRIRADFPTVAAWSAAVTSAYVEWDWAALDYPSWESYLDGEYGEFKLQLPHSLRQEVVAKMSAAQMSSRAIAAAIGVHHVTVTRDQARVANATPDAADESAPDAEPSGFVGPGEQIPSTVVTQDDDVDEIVDAELVDAEPSAPKPITGMDGKTYPKPPPKPNVRKSLVDYTRDTADQLRKVTGRLESIAVDDRLTRNKEQVAARLRHDLNRMTEVCQDLIGQLTSRETTK